MQIALPIMLTILLAAWAQNRRVDELARRVDGLGKLMVIEERTSRLRPSNL